MAYNLIDSGFIKKTPTYEEAMKAKAKENLEAHKWAWTQVYWRPIGSFLREHKVLLAVVILSKLAVEAVE